MTLFTRAQSNLEVGSELRVEDLVDLVYYHQDIPSITRVIHLNVSYLTPSGTVCCLWVTEGGGNARELSMMTRVRNPPFGAYQLCRYQPRVLREA